MTIYLGILGDPAKLERYNDEFYSILKTEENNHIFHLIGASEQDVTTSNYQEMYELFKKKLEKQEFDDFTLFGKNPHGKKFNARIGLFPSHQNQLIKGPGFVFAPFPANSKSRYLKIRARITISLFKKFSNYNITKIAYFPLGGKAAIRSKSNVDVNLEQLKTNFHKSLTNKWFDWSYLEAGSGQKVMNHETIQYIFSNTQNSNRMKSIMNNHSGDIEQIILPRAIYGGGITSSSILQEILEPKNGEPILVPQSIIIGNISEENISTTYQIIEKFNELKTLNRVVL